MFDSVRSDDDKEQLEVQLPSDGTPVDFWVAGDFQHPSSGYGDAAIEAVSKGTIVGRREMMVRIRKDATKLSDAERDRFLIAFGTLNDCRHGIFTAFCNTHYEDHSTSRTVMRVSPHGTAYLLDLERALQDIDASVALPYWRFDQPAPSLFAPAFFGLPPDPSHGDVIQFPAGHPLEFWRTDVNDPIERRPDYPINQALRGASIPEPAVRRGSFLNI